MTPASRVRLTARPADIMSADTQKQDETQHLTSMSLSISHTLTCCGKSVTHALLPPLCLMFAKNYSDTLILIAFSK